MAMSHVVNQTLGEVLYKNITDGTCVPKEPVPLPDGLKFFFVGCLDHHVPCLCSWEFSYISGTLICEELL